MNQINDYWQALPVNPPATPNWMLLVWVLAGGLVLPLICHWASRRLGNIGWWVGLTPLTIIATSIATAYCVETYKPEWFTRQVLLGLFFMAAPFGLHVALRLFVMAGQEVALRQRQAAAVDSAAVRLDKEGTDAGRSDPANG